MKDEERLLLEIPFFRIAEENNSFSLLPN